MKIVEPGVLPTSEVYFHTPSETAQSLYFYLRCAGYYQCDAHYRVRRDHYDSFLLLYVVRGSGYVHMGDRRTVIGEGNIVLLDCYQPHIYGTDSGWDILWVHFDGKLARGYFEQIALNQNCLVLLPDPYSIKRALEKIYRMFHHERRAREAVVSKYIVNILTELLVFEAEPSESSASGMEDVLTYIAQNLDQPLTLETLAKSAALSPYYFSRVFKRETGYTPHEYLIHARVNAAKFYLKTTALPGKEIAFRCGFSSESSFCTIFKRVADLTPQAYRTSGL